ncbi:hypothetical protein FNV43_RR21327 [Rhamnella rubrinervis]|uniref:VQ domain-containing protein n=1 Tax=Rhamnella rubrinervis TaxID=2594499 RepID=A0A8K0GU98_9ROSA|nr:hypothetical protein FNV43_RR21327 [Rhamnella rubrinervis]
MSPTATQFHAKRDNNIVANGLCAPPPLKINKDSHFIKKSSPSSSSSSSSTLAALAVTKPPQRHPVIIYTHSPKIIHTHPRDFMALVQKLTGLSRSDEDAAAASAATNPVNPSSSEEEENKSSRKIVVGNEDNDSSSVITEENCSTSTSTAGDVVVVGGGGAHHHQHHHQANSSCFVQPQPQQTNNPYSNIPVFTQNYSPSDHHNFFCANQPGFYNYNTDALFFAAPNITASISSSSTFQGINDFPTSDY